MHLYQPSEAVDFPHTIALPRRVLKQILTRRGLRIGARVLLVGGGSGQLVQFLDGLGYSVFAIDDRPEAIEQAGQQIGGIPRPWMPVASPASVSSSEYDLILVQHVGLYSENLLSLHAQSATANLLTCLSPEGELVFVRQMTSESESDGLNGHSISCWERHLACFPGRLDTHVFRESFFQNERWDWLVGKRPHRDSFTVTLQIPREPICRADWRQFVEHGTLTDTLPCCSIKGMQADVHQRAA